MLDIRPNARLSPVRLPIGFTQRGIAVGTLVRKVPGMLGAGPNDVALPPVRRIAVQPAFFAMHELSQHLAVVDIGRRRRDRVNRARPRINANVRLHAEIPLVAFFRLMHLGVAFVLGVFRRTRRRDNRGVDDCSSGNLHAILSQVGIHRREQCLSQLVLLQEMAEFADRRFVRNTRSPEVVLLPNNDYWNPANVRIEMMSYNASSAPGSLRLNHCCRK